MHSSEKKEVCARFAAYESVCPDCGGRCCSYGYPIYQNKKRLDSSVLAAGSNLADLEGWMGRSAVFPVWSGISFVAALFLVSLQNAGSRRYQTVLSTGGLFWTLEYSASDILFISDRGCHIMCTPSVTRHSAAASEVLRILSSDVFPYSFFESEFCCSSLSKRRIWTGIYSFFHTDFSCSSFENRRALLKNGKTEIYFCFMRYGI